MAVVRESLQRNPDNQVQESAVTDKTNITIIQDTAENLAEAQAPKVEESA